MSEHFFLGILENDANDPKNLPMKQIVERIFQK